MAINFIGFVYNNAGSPVASATVNLYDRNTTTPVRATTTTDANGKFSIAHGTEGRFDVEIVNGSSKERLKYDDAIQMEEAEFALLNLRNPADTFKYVITPGAIAAERILNLPVLTGTDTLVVLAEAQTLTNKTLTSPTINTPAMGADSIDAITEIAAAIKTGADLKLATGTAGASGVLAEWNVDGDIVGTITTAIARGWAVVASDGTNSATFNVTSTAKDGTGDYTVTWATDFSGSNYAVSANSTGPTVPHAVVDLQLAGSTGYQTLNTSHAVTDVAFQTIAFGPQ